MALSLQQPEPIEVGNNSVVDDDAQFSSGVYNGQLHYYDTNTHLPCPLTCHSLYTFMQENLADPSASERWNAGFVFGFIGALSENNLASFFTSILIDEASQVPSVALHQV